MTMANKLEMDTYEMTDQPETCRHCGVRTNFVEYDNEYQIHKCPECGYTYLLEAVHGETNRNYC